MGVWAYGSIEKVPNRRHFHTPIRNHAHTQSKVFVHVLEIEVAGDHEDLQVVEKL